MKWLSRIFWFLFPRHGERLEINETQGRLQRQADEVALMTNPPELSEEARMRCRFNHSAAIGKCPGAKS